jgi:proteic killer suppression protein
MKIQSVKHKGLRRLFEDGIASGLPARFVDKIRKILAFLQDMENVGDLKAVLVWKARPLTGNRRGTWSLFVSKNWRITFRVDKTGTEIIDLNFEDYH